MDNEKITNEEQEITQTPVEAVVTPSEEIAAEQSSDLTEATQNQQEDAPALPDNSAKKKKIALFAGIGCATVSLIGVVMIIIALVGLHFFGIHSLHKQLQRDWERYDTITFSLDFSEDEIDYSAYGSLIGRYDLATMEYKVTSYNTMKVKLSSTSSWQNIKVEFNDDKTMMILTPAITSTESSEYWFNFD